MHVASIEKILAVLDATSVRYLIAGGVAVNGYGFLRFTKDLDLLVQLTPTNLLSALRALETLGFRLTIPVPIEQAADPSQLARWHEEKNMIVMQMWSDAHRRTPIDIFITEPFAFDAGLRPRSHRGAGGRHPCAPGAHRSSHRDEVIGLTSIRLD